MKKLQMCFLYMCLKKYILSLLSMVYELMEINVTCIFFRSKCKFYTARYTVKENAILEMHLTVVKRSRERSINFPIVIVNFLCDLKINSNKVRLCVGFELYHFASYAASPIILPCNDY